jgi:hypothetical protein
LTIPLEQRRCDQYFEVEEATNRCQWGLPKMKAWINPEIVLGLAIGLVLSLFVGLFLSYQAAGCGQHESACGIVGFLLAAIDYVDNNEGFFVGLFTLSLALFTARLWLATLKSIELSKTRESILERAYLWPGPGRAARTGLSHTVFFITVHNSGKTAGIITDIYYRLSTQADFDAGGKLFCHFQREDVIVPGQPEPTRTGAFVDLIGTDEKTLHGHIVYTDVFKDQHVCHWKHRLSLNGGSDPLPGCYSEWD